MIFQADELKFMRERRKTQTRRPVKFHEKHCRYRVGHVYKAQSGRGQPGEFEVTIFDVRQEPLGEISVQDVRREGFTFAAQFMARWESLHGHADPEQLVWVISFAVGDLRDRFDRPNLLMRGPGHVRYIPVPGRAEGSKRVTVAADDLHQDYTDQPRLAMAGEPEAISGLQLKAFTDSARKHDKLRHLVPAHGALERIDGELRDLRAYLATDGRVSRELHRDIVRLEQAKDRLSRRLAS